MPVDSPGAHEHRNVSSMTRHSYSVGSKVLPHSINTTCTNDSTNLCLSVGNALAPDSISSVVELLNVDTVDLTLSVICIAVEHNFDTALTVGLPKYPEALNVY